MARATGASSRGKLPAMPPAGKRVKVFTAANSDGSGMDWSRSCRSQAPLLSECLSLLHGHDVFAFLAAGRAQRSLESTAGAWEWLKRRHEEDLDIDLLRMGSCALGEIAEALYMWDRLITTFNLPLLVNRAFALKALHRLSASGKEGVATLAGQLALTLRVSSRRECWNKPSPDLEDDDWVSDDSDDGTLVGCNGEISGYGLVVHKLKCSAQFAGYEFHLAAECATDVGSGCFSCWEVGSVSCNKRTRILKKSAPKSDTILEWHVQSADAGDDEEFRYVPAKPFKDAAGALGVPVPVLARVAFEVLASPFRLAGPPHGNAFRNDWEHRLHELMDLAMRNEQDRSWQP